MKTVLLLTLLLSSGATFAFWGSDDNRQDCATVAEGGGCIDGDGAIVNADARGGKVDLTDARIGSGNGFNGGNGNGVLRGADVGNIEDGAVRNRTDSDADADADADVRNSGNSDNTNRSKSQSASRVKDSGNSRSKSAQEQSAYGGESIQGQALVSDQSNEGNNSTNEQSQVASADDSGNSENTFDFSDHSSSAYTYKEVYRAPALGVILNGSTSACVNFLGVQGTGAGKDGAGGVGLGIPLPDRECRLGQAAVLAFKMGNNEAGWVAYCSQKSVLVAGANALRLNGIEGMKNRRKMAYNSCLESALNLEATDAARQAAIRAELAAIRLQIAELEATGRAYDDSELLDRIRYLESAAHRPLSTALIVEEVHSH